MRFFDGTIVPKNDNKKSVCNRSGHGEGGMLKMFVKAKPPVLRLEVLRRRRKGLINSN